ncbi:glutaminase A [Protaetiibacter larvae]|uniref:Glutaminase n=1 Tax=Protaetiibacter larvae TaxID=2592654 RepID=A0A5C1YA38_9MICO|nr:glutaminase A [Protaetiibacter larvae]QEO09752.1 glutaminase A [Protaetiibacter larvae]
MTPESPVVALLRRVLADNSARDGGDVARYIPELAKADPSLFGICLVTADGAAYEVGDTRTEFTIQSISKPFSYALALDELGSEQVLARVGVEPTGDAFNEISLDPATGMPYNPMINAGAITTTGLVMEGHGDETVAALLRLYGRFAGRALRVDEAVYRSEWETAHRNRAIAHLLRGSGALRGDPERALYAYLQQCSVLVDTHDLGVMAATLANDGVNPLTGVRAASRRTVGDVLNVMDSCGMYDSAGDWQFTVGLPAKSGVAGGVIAVVPGSFGIAVFSPALDRHGNSVRGVAVFRQLSAELGLHPLRSGYHAPSPLRSSFTLARAGSTVRRPPADAEVIARRGDEVVVAELQGELDFVAAELVVRRILDAQPEPRFAVVDLRHVSVVHRELVPLVAELAAVFASRGGGLLVSDAPDPDGDDPLDGSVTRFADLDLALQWCEDQLLGGATTAPESVALRDHPVVAGLTDDAFERLGAYLERRELAPGASLIRRGEPVDGLYVLTSGRLSALAHLEGRPARRAATLVAGMIVGERSIAGAFDAIGDVVADTGAACYVLPAERMARLRAEEPGIVVAVVSNILSIAAAGIGQLSERPTPALDG